MTRLELVQVKDKAKVLMGQSPPSSACSEKGDGVPFIQGNAEFGSRSPKPLLRCSIPTRIAEAGDLLLSVRAPVGELNQASECIVIGRGLSAIRFALNDRGFAWHSLKFAAPALNRIAQGTTFVAVSREDVERLVIPWHNEGNSRIAAVLDTMDNAIAETAAVIEKLRQLRLGQLHDLLTRGLDSNGELRDPMTHPEQFQDSAVGRFPQEWDIRILAKLCTHIGSGVTPRGGQDIYPSSGIMFLRSQNITFEGLLLNDVAFISDDIHCGMLRSEVFPHDVLFNITGASIGRCCPMPEGLGTTNVNQHVCALRVPKADAATAKFLSSILSSPIGQKQLDALNTMGNRQGLNYQQLGAFIIPWPNGNERNAIATKIAGVEDLLRSEERELEKLKFLKLGLMDDLLTGQVRVPERVKAIEVSA